MEWTWLNFYNNQRHHKLIDHIDLPDDIKFNINSFINEEHIDCPDEIDYEDDILFDKEEILNSFQKDIPFLFGIELEKKTYYVDDVSSFPILQNYNTILETNKQRQIG